MNNGKPQLQSSISISSSIGEEQRYRLEKQIGGGGMGNVFLATDARLGKQVALKVLKETLVDDPTMLARFEWELAICAALKSQHIVQVSDYGITDDGHSFYVMEYLYGQTLGQLLAQKRRLSPQQTAMIMAQVCAGLQLAHEGINLSKDSDKRVKVIHRDLKPENIFLVPTVLGDFVKIIDFGIAKIRDLQADHSTITNFFLGTCHYASPEQFAGAKDLDERADIYSLGLIMYEMLTGFDPFGFNFRDNRVSGETWLLAHASKSPQPLRSQPHCEHLSQQLEAVVMQCLQKSPQERFASAQELCQALQAAVSQKPEIATIAEPKNELTNFSATPASQTIKSGTRVLRRYAIWLLLGGVCAGGIALSQLSRFSAPMLPEKTVLQQTLAANSAVWSLALSADGQTLMVGGEDQTIKGVNLQTQDLEFASRQLDTVRSLSLSNDSTILASASGDLIKIWDLQGKTLIRTLKGHQSTIWSVDISPDGSMLASASGDRTIKLWNLHTGELLRTLTGHSAPVFAVNFSPDGRTLASASQDNTVKLWNVQGQIRQTLTGHTNAVRDVAFDPTGQYLASASWDGTVKLWERQTGKELHTFAAHGDRAIAVTFSPDGKTLASSSVDRTVKLWDWREQVLLETLSGNADWVLSLVFNASGTNLIGSGKDGTIKIWQIGD